MRAAAVRRELAWILLLGLLGALLAAGIVFALMRLAGVPVEEAGLLTAILAATDPVSVFAVLRRLHVPERLRLGLEGESLVNDGVAVVLFVVALSVVQGQVVGVLQVTGLFVRLTVGGLVVGLALGLLVRWVMSRSPMAAQVGITLVGAYAAYLLADWIHASGLLAVIAMSLLLGTTYHPSSHHLVHRFWRQLGFVVSSVVFLLVGLQVRLDQVMGVGGRLLILVVAMLSARALMVLIVTLPRTDLWPWAWRVALVWAGLRGALSLALALSVPTGVAGQPEILALAFGFIFLSLAFQGLSTGPVFGLLGITRQTAVKSVR
jgi:CPA1 family monovalent cation:H+ antiporter